MSTDVDRRSVPDAATALLTVKIGDISRTSRKHLRITPFRFLLSEGLDVFRAKVDTCTDKALENVRGERYIREDRALYMRPGAHSKQAELVELTHSNFEDRVTRSYRNYLKRKAEDTFQCEVYEQHIGTTFYRPVRMVVNGAIVPVQVNVQDLLGCFSAFQQQSTLGSSGTETHENDVEANGFHE
ncbi:uncharacterized protein PITG_07042 [Phytophthora infestans T30-4]|uniref:Uncharacterized protein n=1 Tax=Phytophthora infestans (strain T30-4) TaxID=403677 RepID=D0N741_PHYIT|nr:uncharacterized protein PITG_07042 [Phytophthora infestans T30-4]EEY53390.1 conserved hypothetical protein [Phytophthora infestans T30-4]|eukprot:XP_002905008.1 conserved hypothetical protein [Phytophthora infestans T30-4]